MENAVILQASESLLRRLRPGDLDATLRSITDAAVEVLPQVQYSSVTMRHADGTLDSYAMTDEVLVELDRHQFELKEGPCYDGATSMNFAVSSDLSTDERYPNFGPLAAEVGIRSQAGIRLFENSKTVGGLNIYSRDVGAFDDIGTVGQLLSHQAAVALAYSIEIQTLREAVHTRGRIGQAVGIVMERYGIPEQRAFAFLTRLSQHRNLKLARVADELITAVLSRADRADPPAP